MTTHRFGYCATPSCGNPPPARIPLVPQLPAAHAAHAARPRDDAGASGGVDASFGGHPRGARAGDAHG
jgi:hypothetical protein